MESPGSEADCTAYTALIGSASRAGDQGVETSPNGVTGNPPTGVRVYFDNFTNVDQATNYAIAICAPAASTANPSGLVGRKATRH
jgi:hypothetical protein